ncbi:MAG: hypothetical protein Q8862_12260 [Bacteroidota bacterium]|nr:hypothetical protein [Bacteroidota bacterium]
MKMGNNNLKGFAGLIGNLVIYNLQSKMVARTRPNYRKGPLSEKRMKHRSSFRALQKLASGVKDSLIRRVWSSTVFTGGMNGYTWFMKLNNRAFDGTDKIQFPELMTVSEGPLSLVKDLNAGLSNGRLVLRWNSNLQANHVDALDLLNVVFLVDREQLNVMKTSFVRSEGLVQIDLPDSENNVSEGFIFWSSPGDHEFSPSVYWSVN